MFCLYFYKCLKKYFKLVAAYEKPLTLHQMKLVYLKKDLNKDDSFEGFLDNTAAIFNLTDISQTKKVIQYHGTVNSLRKILGMGVSLNMDFDSENV